MDLETAIVATLPPFFAIVVELINPVNERAIEPKVAVDLRAFELGANHEHLVKTATKLVSGAVELAGLAPTFVASLTAGLGLVVEYAKVWLRGNFHWSHLIILGGFIAIILLLVLVVMSYLAGQTYFQIEATRQPWPIAPRRRPWCTASRVIQWMIVSTNIFLVLLVWISYSMLAEHEAS
ncbi:MULTISPECIES: hypothetical protein [unclassified Bradyrhizobium]|uniref:hypothetical protein n=1 Tax=unclassified Bradyrhizobium TaxID=2631580 RepID=UPI0029165956|nr:MULTISPECIES: hypothetical protein [unclassified Bradyrhizobium]